MTSTEDIAAMTWRDADEASRDAELHAAILAMTAPGDVLAIKVHARSPHWRTVRENHLKRFGRCEACGNTKNLEVHHKKPFHLFPELEEDATNLMTLCSSGPGKVNCHLLVGHCGRWVDYSKNPVYAAAAFQIVLRERVTA